MTTKPKHIALFLALTAAACTPEGGLDPSDRPEPPPAGAFDTDLSFFAERAPEAGSVATAWAQALETVAAAEEDTDAIPLPALLMSAAAAAAGERDGGVWRWPFSTAVSGAPYDGELRAVVNGNQHEWDLYVTAPDHSPELTDYLWLKAFTPSGGYDGQWWIADAEAGNDIVVARGSWIDNEGGVDLAFSASETVAWTLQRGTENVLTRLVITTPHARVTWSETTGEGSSWTSDTGTSCWDADLNDVAC